MKKLSIFAALILAALGLAACGGGGSSTGGSTATEPTATTGSATGGEASSGSTIKFEANPEGQLMFTAMKVTGKAGNDTIDFKNPSSTPHNLSIEDSSGKEIAATETISNGETKTNANLKPGTYTFFCDVPRHREAGMEGTLTIE